MTQKIADPLGVTKGRSKGFNLAAMIQPALDAQNAQDAAQAAELAENKTFNVATRDPSGLPPSSRLPTPFEGGTRRLGDVKKKQARKELLGD